MSFKAILLFSFLLLGCGVKGPPRPPAGTAVPSFLDSYLKTDQQKSTEVSGESSDDETKKTESK